MKRLIALMVIMVIGAGVYDANCFATTALQEVVILFNEGSAKVGADGEVALDNCIREAPDGATIIVDGFASVKSYKKLEGGNNALSEWRASVVKGYILANKGTKTLTVIGRGHGVLGSESLEKAKRVVVTTIRPEIRIDVVTKIATVTVPVIQIATVTVPVIQTVVATATETKIATVTVPVIQTVIATTTAIVEVKLQGTVTIIDKRIEMDDKEVFSDQLKEARWGVGVNYPGLGVRYGNKKNTIEIRTQIGKDVFAIGPRFYHNIGESVFYGGGEIDYCTFKGSISKCSGYVLGGFAGLEYPVSPNVGLSVDFGPAFISLKDKATGESDSGIDLIINIGLTYYFRGGEKK